MSYFIVSNAVIFSTFAATAVIAAGLSWRWLARVIGERL